jgi:hypothetical protein
MKNKDIAFESKLMEFHTHLHKNKPKVVKKILREYDSIHQCWNFIILSVLGNQEHHTTWQIRRDDFDDIKPKRLANRIMLLALTQILNDYQS